MQQTANYQLNQWDAEDRILRTDFNADNAKIDAAIKTRMGFTPLKDITTTANAQQVNIDVSDIDFGKWFYVVMEYTVKTASTVNCFLFSNNDQSTAGFRNLSFASSGTGYNFCSSNLLTEIFFLPFCSGENPVSTITTVPGNVFCGYDTTRLFKNVQSLTLALNDSSVAVKAGSTFKFWGVNR